MESWSCLSAGMKNVGRRQANQIAPRMRAAASGCRPQRAGIGDEGEGQKGVEPGPAGKALEEDGRSQEPCGKPMTTAAYHGRADRLGTARADRRRTPAQPPVLVAMTAPAMDGPKAAT